MDGNKTELMDNAEKGRRRAKLFWERYRNDSEFRAKMEHARAWARRDKERARLAGLAASKVRWAGHVKKVIKTREKTLPLDTLENLLLKARLCAYFTGDGCLSVRKIRTTGFQYYSVAFFPDDEGMIEKFCEAMMKLYKREVKSHQLPGHWCLKTSCKLTCIDLLRFTKFGSLEWRIPEFVNTPELKVEWIRAFFDCEGYVDKKHITVQSVNREGLLQVQKVLQELSIESKMYTYQRKNPKWNTNYILCIMKKESRVTFLKNIGFNHTRKQKKLQELLADVA